MIFCLPLYYISVLPDLTFGLILNGTCAWRCSKPEIIKYEVDLFLF